MNQKPIKFQISGSDNGYMHTNSRAKQSYLPLANLCKCNNKLQPESFEPVLGFVIFSQYLRLDMIRGNYSK